MIIYNNLLPIYFIVVIIVVALLLFVILIYVLISFFHDRQRRKVVLGSANTFRVYRIDLDQNIVTYFDQSLSNAVQEISFENFLHQYHQDDYHKVKAWVLNLLKKKRDIPWHIQAKATIKSRKNTFFSVIEVTKINYEQKVIHLNSYLLQYLLPDRRIDKRWRRNVITEQEAIKQLSKSSKNRGATIVVDFFYLKRSNSVTGQVSKVFLKQLKDKLIGFLSRGLMLVEKDGGEFILLELRKQSLNEHIQIAHSLSKTLNRYLQVHGLAEEFGFSIGVVENKYFPNDYAKLIKNAKLMAERARLRNLQVNIYDRSHSLIESKAKLADKTIIEILEKQKYTIKFQPIIDTNLFNNFGHYVLIELNDNKEDDYLSIHQAACMSKNSQALFKQIIESVIDKYTKAKKEDIGILFLQASIYDTIFLKKTIAKIIEENKLQFGLVFDGEELDDFEERKHELIEYLQGLKQTGFILSIAFPDMNMLLDNEIYNLFDYYVLDQRMTTDIETDDRRRISLRALIDKLNIFNKPIIAIGMSDIDGVELIDNFDIRLVSSETIVTSQEQPGPLDKKVINKLRQFQTKNITSRR
jgi:EAL domain-containing protein (putative c-di-GMP-specific phosphodiesterase class I)